MIRSFRPNKDTLLFNIKKQSCKLNSLHYLALVTLTLNLRSI